jgi:hypothetical protein
VVLTLSLQRRLLTEITGFVQEIASKGVTLVYELGDEELKVNSP